MAKLKTGAKGRLYQRNHGPLARFRCVWHTGLGGQRICRKCLPNMLAYIEKVRNSRDAYSGSLFSATEQVARLDRELTQASKLLEEAAAIFKRGRYPRPLSNRIVAFLEDSS